MNALARTRWFQILSYVLAGVGLAVLGVLPLREAIHALQETAAQSRPPIEALNPRVVLLDDGRLVYESDGAIYHRDCEAVLVARTLITRHGTIAVPAHIVGGQIGADNLGKSLAAKYLLSTKVGRTPGVQLEVWLPVGMPASDILGVASDQIVPDGAPCEDGWTGQASIHRSLVER